MANVPDQDPSTFGPMRGQITEESVGNLTPPENIIQNISSARSLYNRYRTQNLGRINLFASIEGLIQGNPPYDQLELDQAGLSHIANFNNGDASSIYEQGGLAYWNLLNQAEIIAKFFFFDEREPDLRKYADIMARQWDIVVRGWQSFERQVCTLSSQILKFGYSPAVWPDERDWKWQTVEVSRFFLADQASTDTDLITTVFIETSYTVQKLYEIYNYYKDKKGPKDKFPWNPDELANYLVNRANTYQKFSPPILTPMDLQNRVENGDISFDMIYSDEVRLISMLQKEYDGKFSHYIFDRVLGTGSANATEGSGFLFFVDRQYDTLKEALVLFTASPDVFTVHANRGLGHKIFAPCQATMQLDCDIVNMARLSSTPIIRSPASGSRDFETIQFKPGVPTNIGTAEFVQNQLGANITQLVGAGGYLLNKLNVNLAHSGDDPGQPDRSTGSISPTQARMKSFKEFGVLKNNIAHFYKSFDLVCDNMVTKMLNSKKGYPGYEMSKDWKDKCMALGVPDLLFAVDTEGRAKHFRVKATRVAGDGSTLALIMGLEILGPIVPSFGAKGVKRYQKDVVMATMGPDYVSAYIGEEEPDEIAGGASLAGTENAIMKMGESPIFSPDNEQRSHIAVHFELGRYIIQARSQQQMGARDADKIFTVLVPHLGEHIQSVAKNPLQQGFFGQVKKEWGDIQKYATLNRKNAESEIQAQIKKQQAQQEQTQQVLTEEQLKNLQVTNDEKRKDLKLSATLDRTEKANQTRGEIEREKAQMGASNERLKVQLNAQAKQQNKPEESLPALRQELSGMLGATASTSDIE